MSGATRCNTSKGKTAVVNCQLHLLPTESRDSEIRASRGNAVCLSIRVSDVCHQKCKSIVQPSLSW